VPIPFGGPQPKKRPPNSHSPTPVSRKGNALTQFSPNIGSFLALDPRIERIPSKPPKTPIVDGITRTVVEALERKLGVERSKAILEGITLHLGRARKANPAPTIRSPTTTNPSAKNANAVPVIGTEF